jgi:hypothetical protein
MTYPGPIPELLPSTTEPGRAGGDVTPTPWEQARAELGGAGTYWLATTTTAGGPHVAPVLAVLVDDRMHFCANDGSRKARNLADGPGCVIAASGDRFDLVVEGEATAVSAEATVRRVAEAYAAKYGWRPEERDGLLWAEGAPTAGPPPYRVHEIRPNKAFAFPTDDASTPTRWRF